VSVRNSFNSPVVSIVLTTMTAMALFLSGTVETVLKFVMATSFVANISSTVVLLYVRLRHVPVDEGAVRVRPTSTMSKL